jgi:hypothetical protein
MRGGVVVAGLWVVLMAVSICAEAEVGDETETRKNIRGSFDEPVTLPQESALPRGGIRGAGQDFFYTQDIEVPVDVQYLRSFVGWQYIVCATVASVSAAVLLVIGVRCGLAVFFGANSYKSE